MEKMKNALMVTTLAVGVALAGGSAYAADIAGPAPGVVQAPAPAGLYVSVFAGAVLGNSADGMMYSEDNFSFPTQTGYLIGGALGTHFTPNLRGELEVSYASHSGTGKMDIDGDFGTTADGGLSTLYVLGNLWYDIDLGGPITPYIGAGAGFAVVMPDITNVYGNSDVNFTKSAIAPAAQLGAGFKYQLADNITLDVGYRAKAVFNATLQGGDGGEYPAHGISYLDQSVQAGVTFGF